MIVIAEKLLTLALKEQIFKGFSRHAISMTGHDGLSDSVAFLATDEETFVGAVVVVQFWGALHVKYLYVEDADRGQKVASSLMDRAFIFGKENGCSFAFVETMSFQALGFYQKMGFQIEFTRPGYAQGTSFHYLKRDF